MISLSSNRDFQRAYRKGKCLVNPILVTYIRRNGGNSCRIGITASKKVGNAVKRNRVRRLIREAYRQMPPLTKKGYDIVFVARVKTFFVKSTQVAKVMQRQLKEGQIL